MKVLTSARVVFLAGTIATCWPVLCAQTASPHAVVGTVLPLAGPTAGACAYFTSHDLFCPAQLRQAYMTSFIANSHDGAGITVFIVDAFDLPDVVSDLSDFSSQTGLPQMDGVGGDPTFTKLEPFGKPPTAVGTGWEYQIALDTQWVHAMAPKTNIVLVEALSASWADLSNALSYAVTTASGEKTALVSCSWGVPEFVGQTSFDSSVLSGANVPVIVSTGSSGAPGQFPAVSQYVTAIGGTTFAVNSLGYRSSETGWSSSGGGVSMYEPTPNFQSSNGVNFGARATPDVALDANPSTGVMISLTGELHEYVGVGGAGLACPLFAGFLADVDGARLASTKVPLGSSSNVVNQELYALYNSALYRYDFLDVTSGNNGFSAGPGFDLVTGLGVPSQPALAARLVALP